MRWLRGPVPTSIKRSARSNCRNPSLCTSAIRVVWWWDVVVGCCWKCLLAFFFWIFRGTPILSNWATLTFRNSIFLCVCFCFKHLLHENWSLELRLLTQLSKISTSHQNRSHYDMKPSSSGLKRFLVIRKKKKRPCFAWENLWTSFSWNFQAW